MRASRTGSSVPSSTTTFQPGYVEASLSPDGILTAHGTPLGGGPWRTQAKSQTTGNWGDDTDFGAGASTLDIHNNDPYVLRIANTNGGGDSVAPFSNEVMWWPDSALSGPIVLTWSGPDTLNWTCTRDPFNSFVIMESSDGGHSWHRLPGVDGSARTTTVPGGSGRQYQVLNSNFYSIPVPDASNVVTVP